MAKRFYCLVLSVLMLLSLAPLDLCATAWAEELTAPTLGAGGTVTGFSVVTGDASYSQGHATLSATYSAPAIKNGSYMIWIYMHPLGNNGEHLSYTMAGTTGAGNYLEDGIEYNGEKFEDSFYDCAPGVTYEYYANITSSEDDKEIVRGETKNFTIPGECNSITPGTDNVFTADDFLPDSHNRWYTFTSPVSGRLTVSLYGGGEDASLWKSIGATVEKTNAFFKKSGKAACTFLVEENQPIYFYCYDYTSDGEYRVSCEFEEKRNYCGDNVTWSLDDTGTLTISGMGPMRDYRGMSPPWFEENVTAVVIEDGVTNVGDFAFYGCRELQSVTLPKSVTAIQYAAFSWCEGLESITLPEGLKTVGRCAFARCENLRSLSLPRSVTDIQYYAFGGCASLQNAALPEGLTSLGGAAYYGCRALTAVTVPQSVTRIQYSTFANCFNLSSVSLPDTLQSIGNCAFQNCGLRGTLTLPRSLITLESFAFSGTGLTSVAIPAEVKSVNPVAFTNCYSLTSFSVAADSPRHSVKDGVLFNKDQTTLLCYPAGRGNSLYTVPDSVTTIGEEAFLGNNYLHYVSLPDGLTALGCGAFENCSALKTVSIPSSVNTLGVCAFACCCALRNVTLPDGLTEIGADAFVDCGSLQSITIPDTVKIIQDDAFSGCGLISLTLPEGVAAIGDWAFAHCRQLTTVSLPQSLEYMGSYAFAYCDDLTAATYPGTGAQWDRGVYVSCYNEDLLNVLRFTDSLTVTGLTAAHNGMTLRLCEQGSGEVLASVTVKDGACGVINLPDGAYTLSLAKPGLVPCDTAVTVTDHVLALGSVPALVKKGDVNGAPGADGKAVDVSDMQCLYDYLATGALTGQIADAAYFAAVADCNGDGSVNILDYQALYERVRGYGKRTFIMGIDPEYPPFSYMDDSGEYTGFDVEICKAACDLLGWDFETFCVNWNERLVQLDRGDCDCIWSGMVIEKNMKEAGYTLSSPYFCNDQVIMVKEDSGIKSSADLVGKVVAVQMGTTGESMLAEDGDQAQLAASFAELVTCDSFLKCFTELGSGACDALIADKPVAVSYAAENAGFVVLDEQLGAEEYGIAFRGDEDGRFLRNAMADAVAELVDNGTYARIASGYPEIVGNLLYLQ